MTGKRPGKSAAFVVAAAAVSAALLALAYGCGRQSQWQWTCTGSAFTQAPFAGGSGAADDPYLICSPAQFQAISTDLTANYQLVASLDFTAFQDYAPIGTSGNPFTGVLDGNGYSILNLQIDSTATNVGIFGALGSGGQVMNLAVENLQISAPSALFVGGLAALDSGSVQGFSVQGSISAANASASAVGGIAGELSGGTIQDSDSQMELDTFVGGQVGGLAGYVTAANPSFLINSYAAGSINASGAANIGGLVGEVSGTTLLSISGCYFTGAVTAITSNSVSSSSVGGLVGSMNGTISSSYSSGEVEAVINASTNGFVGGLVGSMNGTISDSYSSGPVYPEIMSAAPTTFWVGGLVGELASGAGITGSYSSGVVSSNYSTGIGGSSIGGLVGESSGTISGSYSTGAVFSGKFESSGGLIGYAAAGSSTSYSYATGALFGGMTPNVGGIVGMGATPSGSNTGSSGASIDHSYYSGSITGYNNLGGLAGLFVGNIADSYANAQIYVTQSCATVGGLVADIQSADLQTTGNPASVTNSYASGAIISSVNCSLGMGGLIGDVDYTGGAGLPRTVNVTNSYAAVTISAGRSHTYGLIGLENIGGTYTVTNSYCDSGVEGTAYCSATNGAQPEPTSAMLTPSTYSGWTTPPWIFIQGQYPTLDLSSP